MISFFDVKKDKDILLLVNLSSSIWHEYWPAILSVRQIDYMLNKFQSFDVIKSQIRDEGYIYNLIYNDKVPAGYFAIHPEINKLFLSKLYIKKEFRHLGIGSEAFDKICKTAEKLNKKSVYLTVNKYNINSVKAYKKWGFKQIDAVVTDIGEGFVMDDFIMEYQL